MTRIFNALADKVAEWAGSPASFVLSLLLIVVWALTGPLFGFSDTWQLVVNTGTTIITFLMVFLIQATQNRDSAAIQAKLDELIRVTEAENRLIGIENLTAQEVCAVRAEIEKKAPGATEKRETRLRAPTPSVTAHS